MICSNCVKGQHKKCQSCACQHSPKPLKELVESVIVLGLVVHPDVALAMAATNGVNVKEETTIDNTTE